MHDDHDDCWFASVQEDACCIQLSSNLQAPTTRTHFGDKPLAVCMAGTTLMPTCACNRVIKAVSRLAQTTFVAPHGFTDPCYS